MNFSASSRLFIERVFSASASWARALSRAPWRSASRASRSEVSMRAMSCPALTASPSRTPSMRTSPGTFALTVAWRTAWMVPDSGSQRASGLAST